MGGHQEPPPRRARLTAPLSDWLGEWANTSRAPREIRWHRVPFWAGGRRNLARGRIVAVADCYDTMTTVRTYKKSMSPKAARAELAACAVPFRSQDRARFPRCLHRTRAPRGRALAWLDSPICQQHPASSLRSRTVGATSVCSPGLCTGTVNITPHRHAVPQVASAPPSTARHHRRPDRPPEEHCRSGTGQRGHTGGHPPLDHDRQHRWRWSRRQ